MDVGFVGLGAMGLPMARHLVEKGHRVTVASRGRGPVEAAVAFGAADGGDPAGVVAAAEVTVVCVPATGDVARVLDAALPALGAGKVVVDCSTIDPDAERANHERVAAAGAAYLDAPVSGGTAGAQRGTLTLMVGGEAATLDAARPALDAFAARVVHVGGPGAGQVVKLANNLLFAAQMLATAEAFTLADRAGIDLGLVHEVLTHSTGDCTAVRRAVPFEGVVPEAPASNGWRPGFTTDLMAKDLDLAVAYGERAGVPVRSAALVREVLARAQAAGFGGEDFSAIGKVVRERT